MCGLRFVKMRLETIPVNETAGGWYYQGGSRSIYYTVDTDGILTQLILEGSV